MFNRILFRSVDRFNPKRSAALLGPATFPLDAFSASRMALRSDSRIVGVEHRIPTSKAHQPTGSRAEEHRSIDSAGRGCTGRTPDRPKFSCKLSVQTARNGCMPGDFIPYNGACFRSFADHQPENSQGFKQIRIVHDRELEC